MYCLYFAGIIKKNVHLNGLFKVKFLYRYIQFCLYFHSLKGKTRGFVRMGIKMYKYLCYPLMNSHIFTREGILGLRMLGSCHFQQLPNTKFQIFMGNFDHPRVIHTHSLLTIP